MTCPACSSNRSKSLDGFVTVHVCRRCDAVFGECWRGDSPVLMLMASEPVPAETLRHFDLTLVGSEVRRVHGWFDPNTRLVHQWG